MCGLSTVVTPAGASLTMYREIRPYANSIWDDNNNNSNQASNLARFSVNTRFRENRAVTYIIHMISSDFSSIFYFFLRTSSARRCQTFYFYFFPCSADHERDWPPCKVVFFGLATNALNVRNNKNNSSKDWGVLRRSRCIQIFLLNKNNSKQSRQVQHRT